MPHAGEHRVECCRLNTVVCRFTSPCAVRCDAHPACSLGSLCSVQLTLVCCGCACRLQEEMKALADERDAAKKALNGAHAVTRKEREELLVCKRRISELEIELQECRQETLRADKTAQKAILQARNHVAAASSQREVRITFNEFFVFGVLAPFRCGFSRVPLLRYPQDSMSILREEALSDVTRLRAELAVVKTENESLRQCVCPLPLPLSLCCPHVTPLRSLQTPV